jgi:hypothetical protein
MALVASSADAIVLVNGQLHFGDLRIRTDRTGMLAVAVPEPDKPPPTAPSSAGFSVGNDATTPSTAPRASCAGRFRYVFTKAGVVDLRC